MPVSESATRFSGSRVLVASSSYPFHRDDYHALFVHEQAKALCRRGAQVRVVTPSTPQGAPGRELWDGVEIERFAYPGRKTLSLTGGEGMVENVRERPAAALAAPALVAAFTVALARASSRWRPDLVLAHWLVPSGLAVALAVRGCPALHIAHSSDVHLLARLPLGAMLCRRLARSGPLLATSEALARRMREARLSDAPLSWHLGVELPAAAARLRPAGARLRVVAMSRLVPHKGLRTLLRAASRVPGVELRIAGSGPLTRPLSEEILGLGLEERVSLVGPVLGDAKGALLASADLFACVPEPRPGAFEDNLPVAVLEAMANGLPILATRTGALPELLEGGAGVLTEPGVEAVAAALRILVDAELRPASAHSRAVAERFSWERSCDRLQEAWRHALA
jgi:glycosyltransferase involved in cell wall biosynthesis